MTPQGDKQQIVFQLPEQTGGYRLAYRFPFWLRNGYTEELYSVPENPARSYSSLLADLRAASMRA